MGEFAKLKEYIEPQDAQTMKAIVYMLPERKVMRMDKDGKWIPEPAGGVPFEIPKP
jgi:hypothetical protein